MAPQNHRESLNVNLRNWKVSKFKGFRTLQDFSRELFVNVSDLGSFSHSKVESWATRQIFNALATTEGRIPFCQGVSRTSNYNIGWTAWTGHWRPLFGCRLGTENLAMPEMLQYVSIGFGFFWNILRYFWAATYKIRYKLTIMLSHHHIVALSHSCNATSLHCHNVTCVMLSFC